VRNYLALLGWGTEDDTTLLTTEELIERFSIERVGRSSAIFDEQKLRWMNGRFMRTMALDEYEARVADHLAATDPTAAEAFAAAPPERRRAACAIVQEKAQTLAEVWPLVRFLFVGPADDPDAWSKVMTPDAEPLLAAALEALGDGASFEPTAIEETLREVVAGRDVKPKLLFQPLRVAITGTTVSPGIFESLAALGREESVARIEHALQRLSSD
jgi:glutamyl-tRNA synthetase